MGFLYWIVVGLIAGWLAGRVMKGGGYGPLVDIILGILGGIVGGWVFGVIGIWPGGGIIGSIIVAFIGAVILVWITRLLKKAWLFDPGSVGLSFLGVCFMGASRSIIRWQRLLQRVRPTSTEQSVGSQKCG